MQELADVGVSTEDRRRALIEPDEVQHAQRKEHRAGQPGCGGTAGDIDPRSAEWLGFSLGCLRWLCGEGRR
jgi:hypothetical protein